MRLLSCDLRPRSVSSVPDHAHDRPEWHYIVAGHGAMAVGSDEHRLAPGDLFAVPRRMQHGLRVRRGEWIVQYVLHSEVEDRRDRDLMRAWWRAGWAPRRVGTGQHAFFAACARALVDGDRWHRRAAELRFAALLCGLLATGGDDPRTDTHPALARALELMRRRIAGRLQLGELAAVAGLDRAYFARLFKAQLGLPPMRYFTDLKLRLAAQHLRTSDRSIAQIAESLGFDDPFYFSRRFRAWAGCSPSAYRLDDTATP